MSSEEGIINLEQDQEANENHFYLVTLVAMEAWLGIIKTQIIIYP